jgi:hypothetical protein
MSHVDRHHQQPPGDERMPMQQLVFCETVDLAYGVHQEIMRQQD